ncbi:MAG: hypothetical protein O2854_07455, partial [Chloroflexi bacterium]|nr:hypothetical protein [Chloroflexota bacterium]
MSRSMSRAGIFVLMAALLLTLAAACGSSEPGAQPTQATGGSQTPQATQNTGGTTPRILGEFKVTGTVGDRRQNFGMALLDDGRVLIAGGRQVGFGSTPDGAGLKTAELYDP